jgi:hypothetical protein
MSTIININYENNRNNRNSQPIQTVVPFILSVENLTDIPEALIEYRYIVEKKENKCVKYICLTIMSCLFLLYYFYGILFLVKYKNINDKCQSNIWDCILSGLLVFYFYCFVYGFYGFENIIKQIRIVVIFIINMYIIGMWGLYLYYNEKCKNIMDTPIFDFIYYISLIQLSIGFIIFMFLLFYKVVI